MKVKIQMKIKLTSDDRINLLLVAFISFDVCVQCLNSVLYIPIFNTGLATYLCSAIYFAIIMCALPVIMKRINYKDVIVLLLIIIVLICSYLLFPHTRTRMGERLIYFFQALPWLFVGRCVVDYRLLLSWLEKAAMVTIIFGAVYYFIRIVNMYDNNYNNMVYAYKFLPSCIIMAYDLVRNINIKNIIFNIIGISVLFLCGCRGAILCFAVALLIFIYFFAGKRWYKVAATLIFASAILFIMTDYFSLTAIYIYGLLRSMGVNNRIFRQILADTISDGTGRDLIAKQVILGISKRPLTGYGLYGDVNLNDFGVYSHNIILELMASFGVPIGLLIFLTLMVSFLISMISKKFITEYRIVLLVFFCAGVIKLFVSGSFLEEAYLFLLVGMLASNKKCAIKAVELKNLYGVQDGEKRKFMAI